MTWLAVKLVGSVASIGAIAGAIAAQYVAAPSVRKTAPYIDLMADVRSAPSIDYTYRPDWKGQRATYFGNVFGSFSPDFVVHLRSRAGSDGLLGHSATLKPGDRIEVTDSAIYDLAAGAAFVRVTAAGKSGYMQLDTLFGETPADGVDAIPLSGGGAIYEITGATRDHAASVADKLSSAQYEAEFALAGHPGIHPLKISLAASGALLWALREECEAPLRSRIIDAGRAYMDRYVIPAAQDVSGTLGWPYPFPWELKPGIQLAPGWRSGYANAVIAMNAGIMAHLTGSAEYRRVAEKAAAWAFLPLEDGGALYRVSGFPHVAEYAYAGALNVRVLDGELATAVAFYNLAVLTKDGGLLQKVVQIIAGLSVDLPHTAPSTGYAINSRFGWVIDSPSYLDLMKRWAMQLYGISKDGAFKRAADRWRLKDRR